MASDPGLTEALGAFPVASSEEHTVSSALARAFHALGIERFFGVSGGAIAFMWEALERGPSEVVHCRHEAGAAFAAVEASLVSGRPVGVFVTTGPGLMNVLTGMCAARAEGARVLLVSATTDIERRGRGAFQESHPGNMPSLYASGLPFDAAPAVDAPRAIPACIRRLSQGFARPGGFVAHLSIPPSVQAHPWPEEIPVAPYRASTPIADEPLVAECVERLQSAPCAIWVGFGARHAGAAIVELAERIGAVIMCTPRGKGVVPESHPLFVGVTGLGGHASVARALRAQRPAHLLVLGSRLGEFASFWLPSLLPRQAIIQVDVDPDAPGVAYPEAETIAVHSTVASFTAQLLAKLAPRPRAVVEHRPTRPEVTVDPTRSPVRPEALFAAVQTAVVDATDAVVMTEAGNAFAWGTRHLRFEQPGRYRTSTGYGSMGHAVTGMIGAALARKGKAVAIVGDGALLMNGGELSTAVASGAQVVWVVLDDGAYNMCRQGIAQLGLEPIPTAIPPTDITAFARSMGVPARRVEREGELLDGLRWAMAASEPCLLDVVIDARCRPELGARIESLRGDAGPRTSTEAGSIAPPVMPKALRAHNGAGE